MRHAIHPGDRRQAAYLERSRAARFYAKLLMPVSLLVLSTGIWADPVLNPRLMEGLEVIRPVIEAVLDGQPINEALSLSRPAAEVEAEAGAGEVEEPRPGLPASVLTVNRPSG